MYWNTFISSCIGTAIGLVVSYFLMTSIFPRIENRMSKREKSKKKQFKFGLFKKACER